MIEFSEAEKKHLDEVVYHAPEIRTKLQAAYLYGQERATQRGYDPATGAHSHDEVLKIEKRYEETIARLEKERDQAVGEANENWRAARDLRVALVVIQDLAISVERASRDVRSGASPAALAAIAHICDNAPNRAKECTVGEIPF